MPNGLDRRTVTPSRRRNAVLPSRRRSYDIDDGAGGSATGTVSVSVISNNSPPVAGDDTLSTPEDAAAAIDVVANDTDADGGALAVTAVGQPAHGSTAIDGAGHIVYTPAADYHGPDAFTYVVADQIGATANGSVTVTVTPVNDAPSAVDDGATTTEDTPVDIAVVANDTDIDGDDLTVLSVAPPALGSALLQPDGSIRYTPPVDYYGGDSFSYTIDDGAGGTDTGSVSVSIAAANDVPIAVAKTVTTAYQTAATVTLSGSDVETCDLTFQIVTPPGHGTLGAPSNVLCVTLLPPYADSSKVVYTPAAGYSGPDSFTYRTSDGSAWSPPATVNVTVTSPTLIHVGDLDGTRTIRSTSWTATVTIRAHNASHVNVSGVTVTGSWSAGASGTATCKTSSGGTCQMAKSAIPKTTASVTFTVTGMSLKASAYDPTANHDPETDSTGTVIVVKQVP